MKTLYIGIASSAQMQARTLASARGEDTPARGEPTVWFSSVKSFAQVLSERNRALLALIAREKPDSLTELARLAGEAEKWLKRPVIAINNATYWYGIQANGRDGVIEVFGSLMTGFRELPVSCLRVAAGQGAAAGI